MHDCVGCGCACYCHGDIDDCQVETVEYSWMHCETCGCSEDEVFEDSDEDWDDLPDTCEIFPPDQADGPCMKGEQS